jgi:hypothetical protein
MQVPAMHDSSARAGGERRRNHVLVTLNSEYHCRDDRCIAVRDRRTGAFVSEHRAIGKRLTAGIRYGDDGGIAQISLPDDLLEGERLCFVSREGDQELDVVTSPLLGIERPPKELSPLYLLKR